MIIDGELNPFGKKRVRTSSYRKMGSQERQAYSHSRARLRLNQKGVFVHDVLLISIPTTTLTLPLRVLPDNLL